MSVLRQRLRQSGGTHSEQGTQGQILHELEYVFGVLKRLWSLSKVRYLGLAKNATRAFAAVALANIFMSHKRLMA